MNAILNKDLYDTTLSNGLRLYILERHYLPIVTTMIWYRVGGAHSQIGTTGMAHLIEHLLFKGTERFQRGDIDLLTQKMGGSNNAFTSSDCTGYYFNFPSSSWKTALEIEADRMVNCRWSKREFESEKQVILEELAASEDSPLEFVTQEAESMLYQRHPYRYPILGWREDLQNLSLGKVVEYYNSYYAPNNALLVVVGDVRTEEAVAEVKKFFGHIPPASPVPEIQISEPRSAGQKRIVCAQDVAVPRFAILLPTCQAGTVDSCLLDLVEIVLSWGKSSRFFRDLIQTNSQISSLNAEHSSRKYAGLFWIYGELAHNIHSEALESLVARELKRIASRPVGKHELQKAKNLYLSGCLFDQETNYELANQIARYEMTCGYSKFEEMLAVARNAESRDLQKAAARYLDMDLATVAWSIPKGEKPSKRPIRTKAKKNLRIPRWVDRMDPPSFERGSEISFAAGEGTLPVESHVLSNGLALLILKNPRLPFAAMEIYSRRTFDEAGKEGTGALAGALMQDGSRRYRGDEIAQITDCLGAEFSTGAAGVSAKFLRRDSTAMLELAADVVMAPAFSLEDLHRQKKKWISHLLAEQDSPFHRAKKEFHRIVYGDHPCGRGALCGPKSVARISQKDVRTYWQKRFVPSRTLLAVVGDVDPEDMCRQVEKIFGHWKASEAEEETFPEIAVAKAPTSRHIFMDKQQAVVYWGHLGVKRDNPDYYRLRVLDHILGEGTGFTDRLSKKIRDELGLCYSIEASTTALASEYPGLFTVSFSTGPENLAKAILVVRKEIDSIQKKGVSRQEVENVKRYLLHSIWFSLEENEALLSLIIRIHTHRLGFDYLRSFVDAIGKIQAADIRRVACEYLHPECAATVVVGPRRCEGIVRAQAGPGQV